VIMVSKASSANDGGIENFEYPTAVIAEAEPAAVNTLAENDDAPSLSEGAPPQIAHT